MTRTHKLINLAGIVLPFVGLVAAVVVLWERMVGPTELAILAVGYVVTGGILRITPEGGKANDAALDHGAVLYIPAENHAAENVGPTTIKVIVTELKDPPAKKK